QQGLVHGAVVGRAHRPRVAGRGGAHAEQECALRGRVRAWHLGPGRAVPVLDQRLGHVVAVDEVAHRPDVRGGGGTHGAKIVLAGTAYVRARHLGPGGAVPVHDQGLVRRAVEVLAHRPYVAGGQGVHTEEPGLDPGVGACHLGPGPTVPVHDQRLLRVVFADRPRVTRRQ